MDCPKELDGATVRATATVTADMGSGETRHFRDGLLANASFEHLVLAQYEDDVGVYMFYCDSEWNVITDTYHDDMAHAEAQARYEYPGISFAALSPNEPTS